jgi:hypothetical protein
LPHKAVPPWWHTFRWWRGLNGGMEVAKTTVKRLLCCGFWHTGEAMGQVYQCWWRICREINVFSRFKYHMFYVLYEFVTYLLTLPHIYICEFNNKLYCHVYVWLQTGFRLEIGFTDHFNSQHVTTLN